MTNKEAIEQLEWVKKRICEITYSPESFEAINIAIEKLREDRQEGEWIKVVQNLCWHYECNQCHERPLMARLVDKDVLSNYCPNCGAKLKRSVEE